MSSFRKKDNDEPIGVEVPFERLSADVLRGVIEEFVTREGTDYGDTEFSLEEKVEHVRQQLQQGKAVILFNPDDETCSIQTGSALNQYGR